MGSITEEIPMSLLPKVPLSWSTVLVTIRPRFTETKAQYIAGGALRDLFLGREPKDIDIFTGPDWNVEAAKKLGEIKWTKKGAPFDQDPESWSAADDTIETVANLTIEGLPPFQIIERPHNPEPMKMLERFDFGICRVAWDAQGYYIHNDFVTDFYDRAFKARANLYPDATLMRAQRFAERFHGWDYDLRKVGGRTGQW
jgi:hypothetical protein